MRRTKQQMQKAQNNLVYWIFPIANWKKCVECGDFVLFERCWEFIVRYRNGPGSRDNVYANICTRCAANCDTAEQLAHIHKNRTIQRPPLPPPPPPPPAPG